MSSAPDNPAKGPDIPPELLNEYLYGIHLRLDDGEEESFVDPNTPSESTTPGPEIPPELLNEYLYGVHLLLDGGEEECLIDPNNQARAEEDRTKNGD